jgi:hypothetical protein
MGYQPSIRFPNRHTQEHHTSNITLSGKKIKLTIRDALNQALSE